MQQLLLIITSESGKSTDNHLDIRNFDELKNGTLTMDKPTFEAQGKNLGAVDIKINHLGNRLAVSSLDYGLSIYNIHQESGLTLYRDIQKQD